MIEVGNKINSMHACMHVHVFERVPHISSISHLDVFVRILDVILNFILPPLIVILCLDDFRWYPHGAIIWNGFTDGLHQRAITICISVLPVDIRKRNT